MKLQLGFTVGAMLYCGVVWAAPESQYNMSLQNKVVTGPNGSLTSPQAASVDLRSGTDEKTVREIEDGIYRIAG